MIRIAICDDDALFIEKISKDMGKIFENAIDYHLEKFTSGNQLLSASGFDIVLLDIEMEGLDGLETARKLRERGDDCKLVFLTSHKQYVFAAFDVETAHYLIKPVDTVKLREVLLRLAEKIAKESERYLAVKRGGSLYRVQLSKICFLEVLDRMVFVHTAGETFDFYEKLERLEQTLPENFFRCHRSYIVNFAHIRRYDKTEITLANGEKIPVAKRKYPAFCLAFLHFLEKDGGVLR